ncbi:unnamed protein product [Ilex paraguariensis]|uniref:non-specific serine/threonine protein kinase n=1 Tax=Ilex paraguariensis TaxID=185542 RepID=A0ABC8V047_9AQUA
MGINILPLFCYLFVETLSYSEISVATDMLRQFQAISDVDNGTLVSVGKVFQLGFFAPGNSNRRYLGIWYNNIPSQAVVWVANRDNPLDDSSGVLRIENDGNLVLLGQTERVAWSTNTVNLSSINIVAQLLDTGNLVLRDERNGNSENYVWQSFDHPCDAMLAGMKLGWDLRIGLNRYLTSWKSADDPSPGDFSYGIEIQGLAQIVLRKGSVNMFRSGPWNGVEFNGITVSSNVPFIPKVINNSEEMYFQFSLSNESTLTMSELSYSGALQRLVWDNSYLRWHVMSALPRDQCESYSQCGPNAICTVSEARICSCLTGYMPKFPQDWEMLICGGGCIRNTPLNCSSGEGFIELEGVKMPDLLQFLVLPSLPLEECRLECLKNCSCTAYANSGATGGGTGCLLWFADLIDMKKLTLSGSQKLYIRAGASDLVSTSDSNKKKMVVVVLTISATIAVVFVIASCIIWMLILPLEQIGLRRAQRQPKHF